MSNLFKHYKTQPTLIVITASQDMICIIYIIGFKYYWSSIALL